MEPNKAITDDGIKISKGPDFSNFFLVDFLAYLQLKCEEETFHVHKVVLAAASPYFKTMFQHDMTKARSGSVEVKERSSQTSSGLSSNLVVITDRHGPPKLEDKALEMIVKKKEQVENFDNWPS